KHVKGSVTDVVQWKEEAVKAIYAVWEKTFDAFCARPHTSELLGKGAKVLYQYVRQTLSVPFHQGFVEHPTIQVDELNGRPKKTVGGWISIVHDAIKDGSLYGPLIELAAKGLVNQTNGHVNGYTNGTNGKI
ncbi:hypothetical protein PC116_g34618, partial [Phytophthora cactorum]